MTPGLIILLIEENDIVENVCAKGEKEREREELFHDRIRFIAFLLLLLLLLLLLSF